jgi:hypothetical protein
MNLKNKLSIYGALASFYGMVSIIGCCFILQGCEENESQFRDNTEMQLQSIASQYGLNIEFDSNYIFKEVDLEKFDELCAGLSMERDEICGEYEILDDTENGGEINFFKKTDNLSSGIVRLKSVSEGSGTVSKGVGTATFYVGLEYDINNGEFVKVNKIASWMSGLDPYESYEQQICSATCSPDRITFSVTGIRKTSDYHGVHITYTIQANGYYGVDKGMTVTTL